jgi:endonuclease VIII-like 1
MPELSEVKIMSDFINHIVAHEPFFDKIEKSPESKVKTELDVFDGGIFTMQAESRGKELKITLEMVGGELEKPELKSLALTMGMSGNWIYVDKNSENLSSILKHAHLRFISTRGNYLVLHDIRRFAKWKWQEHWNKGRGPCPLTEYDEFRLHVISNWQKNKSFKLPIYELLMNQRYFNGVGNYIRSEVLYRMQINPFTCANELDAETIGHLISTIHMCFRDSYALGGGKYTNWFNPNGTNEKDFSEWLKCYGNHKMSKIKDPNGRTFWYDPIWER